MRKKYIIIVLLFGLFFSNCKKEQTINNQQFEIKDEDAVDSIQNKINVPDTKILKTDISRNCHSTLLTLLNSSKQFKKDIEGLEDGIKKNGGKGIITNIEDVYNEKGLLKEYVCNVSENYPDRLSIIATYIYNINSQNLYKKHFILDEYTKIDFDKNILVELNKNCTQN